MLGVPDVLVDLVLDIPWQTCNAESLIVRGERYNDMRKNGNATLRPMCDEYKQSYAVAGRSKR